MNAVVNSLLSKLVGAWVTMATGDEQSRLLQQACLSPKIFKVLYDTFQGDKVSVAQYVRKASEFSRNLKGTTKRFLEEGAIRYEKSGRYIIKDAEGNIFVVWESPMSPIEDLLAQLDALSGSGGGPFPYEGCRRLRAAVGERHDGLVPDLDAYLSEFAGYRSWGNRILTWSNEKIATVANRLSQSFFERFPAYAELEPVLEATEFIDVRRALQNAEQTREVLLHLLLAIRKSRAGTDR